MAIFAAGNTQASVTASVMNKLANLYRALVAVQELHGWLTAYAQSDLVTLGFSAGDAAAVFGAVADANEIATLYFGGGLGAYTLPFNFSVSQLVVLGPGT